MSDQETVRLFMALLPPPAIQAAAAALQQELSDRFASRAAQKSPPHITLHPPFTWPLAQLPDLTLALTTFAAQQQAVPITLDGFGAFPPRVIYIQVARSPGLLQLQQDLAQWLTATYGIQAQRSAGRRFTPHLTVAFRDLTPANFQLAWLELAERSFAAEFMSTDLTLLRHTGQHWVVQQRAPYQSRSPL